MCRFLIASCLFSFFLNDASATAAGTLRPFRFAEVKRIREISHLPPKLNVVFDLMCNERFLRVIRYDEVDSKTSKVTIVLGVLVEENLLSSCAGEMKEMEVSAGSTFSGREYSVSLIKR